MKHRTWIFGLSGSIALFCSAALFTLGQQASAQDLGVIVLRGTAPVTGTNSIEESREWEVSVIRGRPAPYQPMPLDKGEEDKLEAVAGFNGWFIDHATNRIGNCFRINTSDVGVTRIKCVWKRL